VYTFLTAVTDWRWVVGEIIESEVSIFWQWVIDWRRVSER